MKQTAEERRTFTVNEHRIATRVKHRVRISHTILSEMLVSTIKFSTLAFKR
jgi:hypothetical protein